MSRQSILLLGATGVSGQAIIKEAMALPSPPKLTLYVRSTSKLPPDIETHARVVIGALGDEESLATAMDGVDTVVSVMGAYPSLSAFIWRNTETPLAEDLKIVLKVMKSKGIRRILALSTPAYYVHPETRPLYMRVWVLLPHILLPQANAEMVAIAKAVAAEDELDWTIFRVPYLNEGSADLPVWAGLLGPDYKGSLQLSRASQARWILKEIEQRVWIKGAPSLGNY